MWESRRDFQRVWEGWKAGFMAFHPSHTLSFPWPAFVAVRATSWHRSYRSEAHLGHVEFSQLNIAEVDAKEVFVHLLEPEIFE